MNHFIRFVEKDFGIDDFSKRRVFISGWIYDGGIGLFDSYVSALADSMGMWEEYCDFHRSKI